MNLKVDGLLTTNNLVSYLKFAPWLYHILLQYIRNLYYIYIYIHIYIYIYTYIIYIYTYIYIYIICIINARNSSFVMYFTHDLP